MIGSTTLQKAISMTSGGEGQAFLNSAAIRAPVKIIPVRVRNAAQAADAILG